MRILVTGATGLLGQELCPMLQAQGWQFWATNSKIFDITNATMVKEIMNKVSLDFIVHLAGYTNVDQAEVEREKAFDINYKGTKNIAQIAKKLDVPILYVSTDMVFDGKSSSPYAPNAATNPINVYGSSKLMGENAIRELCKKHYIIRTSWLYGCGGKNFVDTMLTFSSLRDEISVVDDQIGCPTWTKDLCEKIIELMKDYASRCDSGGRDKRSVLSTTMATCGKAAQEQGQPFGTYHMCGSGSVTYSEFTKKIYEIKKRNVKVNSIAMSDFPRPAKRPKFSALDNSNSLPYWENSLANYLSTR